MNGWKQQWINEVINRRCCCRRCCRCSSIKFAISLCAHHKMRWSLTSLHASIVNVIKIGVTYGPAQTELHSKIQHKTMNKLVTDNKPLKMYIHWSVCTKKRWTLDNPFRISIEQTRNRYSKHWAIHKTLLTHIWSSFDHLVMMGLSVYMSFKYQHKDKHIGFCSIHLI